MLANQACTEPPNKSWASAKQLPPNASRPSLTSESEGTALATLLHQGKHGDIFILFAMARSPGGVPGFLTNFKLPKGERILTSKKAK